MKTNLIDVPVICRAWRNGGMMLMSLLVVCLALSSCASSQSQRSRQAALNTAKARVEQPPLYDWRGDGLSGPTTVNVVLNEQKAYIYKGGHEAGWTYVASGRPGHDTPTGSFTVLEKKPLKHSETYGSIVDASGNVINSNAEVGKDPIPRGGHFEGAPMPHWMRLTGGGVGMHAGFIPQPGSPASHGCIRLPRDMAEKLYDTVGVGTKVIITQERANSSPQYVAGAE